MGREEEDLALSNGDVEDRPSLRDLEHHVALELVEELLPRVVVEVDPAVRAAHHHDDHARLLEHELVADGGLEEIAVALDPRLEVEWCERRVGGGHRYTSRAAGSVVAAVLAVSAGRPSPHASNAARVAARSSSERSSIGRRTGPPA